MAVKHTLPVMAGFLSIGIAFGLLLTDKGYPWWLALEMGVVMFAGSGQFLGVALFAAGAGIAEAALAQFVLNARHIAYSISMFKRLNAAKPYKYYLIYALCDETFALISSIPGEIEDPEEQNFFMFITAILNQFYWVAGSVIGAVTGTLIPFNLAGIDFSLIGLFIVLMIEQILKVRKMGPFIAAALITVGLTIILPSRFSLVASLAAALAVVQIFGLGNLTGDTVLGLKKGDQDA
jgi:4-azaleucine resistance transporter AzlC